MRRWAAVTALLLVGGCSVQRSGLGDGGMGPPDGGGVEGGATDAGSCDVDEDCDDGNACDGTERCVDGRCVEGDPVDCDDGVACTIDSCADTSGMCGHEADDARCGDGELCHVTDGCQPSMECDGDADCSDGMTCNGEEVCDPADPGADERGCVDGTPLDCDDGVACTTDRCVEPSGCESTATDADGDGEPVAGCEGGRDCDDSDPDVHPGADDLCDGIDNDCNGSTADGSSESWFDAPCDGNDSDMCAEGTQQCIGGAMDCTDDTGDSTEECNAMDDDCDGPVDEGNPCSGCEMRRNAGHIYLFCTSNMSWTDARQDCRDRGYELVTIEGSSEDGWIDMELLGIQDGFWWIGRNDEDGDGTWTWSSGSGAGFTDWRSSPNGSDSGDCGAIDNSGGDRGDWRIRDCSNTFPYICEVAP